LGMGAQLDFDVIRFIADDDREALEPAASGNAKCPLVNALA